MTADRQTMRVLFLNENIGGHVTVHKGIRRAVAARQDVEAEIVDVPPPALTRRLLAAPFPGLDRLDLDLQPLRYQLAAAAVARRLIGERLARFDALHVYTQNAALLSTGLVSARPTVVSTDSTNKLNAFVLPYRYPTRFTSRMVRPTMAFERRVYRAATIIVASSKWVRASLVGDYGVPEEKIRLLPFGIQVPEPALARRNATARITFVGRSMERKGGWRLLDLHQHELRDRCILTLVTEEPLKDGLPNVEIRNDVRPGDGKLASIFAETDVFVFPSTMDQSPNAVLEAMAAGLPVVALPVAAVPEMVVDGVTGLLVDQSSDTALASAIRSLLDDPAKGRTMGSQGRERVVTYFDATTNTSHLLDIVGEAVMLHETAERKSP